MVVTVLYRMEGEPEVPDIDMPFTDVAEDIWYTDAIKWAVDNAIAFGFGDGTFRPDDSVTREQMAAFICRYAEFTKTELPEEVEYSGFTDNADISGYAVEYIEKLFKADIVRGKDNNRFDPKGLANRAEFSAVLHRYLTAINA